jgi:hypothetical protein
MTKNDHWYDIAVKLKDENIAEPILWLGDHNLLSRAKNKFGDEVVKDFDFYKFKSHKISGLKYDGKYNNFFMSDTYLITKDRVLKMMDRLDDISMMSRLDRETIFNNTVLWTLDKIEKQRPDALITVEAPHTHIYYTIFQICKFLNIPCFKFSSWTHLPLLSIHNAINNKILPVNTGIDKKYNEILLKAINEFVNNIYNSSQNYSTHHTDVLRLTSKSNSWKLQQTILLLKDIFRKYKSKSHYLESKQYNPLNPFKFNSLKRLKLINTRRKNLTDELKMNKNDSVSLEEKFVYFGLHYEPERTTLPDGGIFHDQFLAILKLRELVPNNIKIYIKEHPSMFYKSTWGYKGRSPIFYNLLNNIYNVEILGNEHKSLELIRACMFTATISGTVGFESAVIGKQALIFGDCWYKGCPNTVTWTENLEFTYLINKKLSDKNEIIDFIKLKLENESVLGNHNSTTELRFKNFISENFIGEDFNNLQLQGIYNLLKETLTSKI